MTIRTNTRECPIALAAALLFVLALCGCGHAHSAANALPAPVGPTPQALHSLVGYWVMPGGPGEAILEVRETNGSFSVAWNGSRTPRRVPVANGRLVLAKARVLSDGSAVMGSELGWQKGHALLYQTYISKAGEPVMAYPHPAAFVRLDAKGVAAHDDQTTRWWSVYLAGVARTWAMAHGGRPPEAAAMNPASAFGAYVRKHGGSGWPFNFFVGRPMRVGQGEGDFSYTVSGTSFRLVAHLSGGKQYVAAH